MTERGVIYVAMGQRYIDEARISVSSLKQYHPELPVTLFTNQSLSDDLFDCVEVVESCGNGLRDRTLCLLQSPYEQTLFLDSDTFVCDDIEELFDLLDHFDMAAAHAPNRRNVRRDDVPVSFPEFNLGVWVFRRSEPMNQVFVEWLRRYDEEEQNWEAGKKHLTQPTFRVAIYHSDIRFTNLTSEYNCRYYDSGFLEGRVKILHGHADFELLSAIAQEINRHTHQRVHVAGRIFTQQKRQLIGGLAIKPLGRFLPSPFERAIRQIQSDGLSGLFSKIVQKLGR